jgi:hypothetical protein
MLSLDRTATSRPRPALSRSRPWSATVRVAYAARERHPVVADSSAIRMNPADVPGVGLVISSLTWVVATGSKLMADGWPLAVAQVTLGLLTGAKAAAAAGWWRCGHGCCREAQQRPC